LGTTVLDGDGIAMIVKHVCEEIDGVSVVGNRGVTYDSKGMKLVTESSLANNELGGICSV
jgi:hypothetical protein